MDSKSKSIIENQMTISEIEKKFSCTTDRAVILFCKALGIKKPNTDQLEPWSKQKLKNFFKNSQCSQQKTNKDSVDQNDCSSCSTCNGHCSC